MPSTTSADVVLDANVIVGWLDASDSLAARAVTLLESLEQQGVRPLMLDIYVTEALSVLCRRSRERKKEPPDLNQALRLIREWLAKGEIQFTHSHQAQYFGDALDTVAATDGAVNFMDALSDRSGSPLGAIDTWLGKRPRMAAAWPSVSPTGRSTVSCSGPLSSPGPRSWSRACDRGS